jgi:hypothetical protein
VLKWGERAAHKTLVLASALSALYHSRRKPTRVRLTDSCETWAARACSYDVIGKQTRRRKLCKIYYEPKIGVRHTPSLFGVRHKSVPTVGRICWATSASERERSRNTYVKDVTNTCN